MKRFVQELCRALEGRVYASLAAKQEVLKTGLKTRQDNPVRVRRLCGWNWSGRP